MKKNYLSIFSFRKRLSCSLAITLIAAFFICLGFGTNASADINVGDILVADDGAGENDRGVIFIIDPDTGSRTILTDFGRPGQGPLGDEPRDLAMEPDGNICVIDNDSGTDGIGQLFRVDATNGVRTVISDFGNPAQGPLGDLPQGLALFTNGDLYVTDRDAPNGDGGLFRVDKITGFRTLITDLSDNAQGPTGESAHDVAEGPGGAILLITSAGSTDNRGLLFQVDPVTGFRTVVSDMGNIAQGPLAFPRWLALPPVGNVIYALNNQAGNQFLFAINPATGNRVIISDFANAGQGPTDTNAQGIAIDGSGQILVNGNGSEVLFLIDPITGNRTVVTDYSNPPIGDFGLGITVATVATQMVSSIPTLSEWGLIAMAGVLGIIGLFAVRRKKVAA